jgi:hypothetical protein
MARIRTIKPEFWTDDKTGTLSVFAKCLFLGLLNHADDYGVIEWRPNEWRVKIFPYDSDTTTVLVERVLVAEILPRGLAVMFSHDDEAGAIRRFLFIRNFHKHQVVNKPSRPNLDGWKKSDTPETYATRIGAILQILYGPDDMASLPTTAPLQEPSRSEGKGREGNKKEPSQEEGLSEVVHRAPVRVLDGGRA